jgi:hypothetical protein
VARAPQERWLQSGWETASVKLPAFALAMIVVMVAAPRAENWPQWRGPLLNGTSPDTNLPLKWSKTENVAWRLALPAWSGSTPAVWNDRIFINVAERGDLFLWCLASVAATAARTSRTCRRPPPSPTAGSSGR